MKLLKNQLLLRFKIFWLCFFINDYPLQLISINPPPPPSTDLGIFLWSLNTLDLDLDQTVNTHTRISSFCLDHVQMSQILEITYLGTTSILPPPLPTPTTPPTPLKGRHRPFTSVPPLWEGREVGEDRILQILEGNTAVMLFAVKFLKSVNVNVYVPWRNC